MVQKKTHLRRLTLRAQCSITRLVGGKEPRLLYKTVKSSHGLPHPSPAQFLVAARTVPTVPQYHSPPNSQSFHPTMLLPTTLCLPILLATLTSASFNPHPNLFAREASSSVETYVEPSCTSWVSNTLTRTNWIAVPPTEPAAAPASKVAQPAEVPAEQPAGEAGPAQTPPAEVPAPAPAGAGTTIVKTITSGMSHETVSVTHTCGASVEKKVITSGVKTETASVTAPVDGNAKNAKRSA